MSTPSPLALAMIFAACAAAAGPPTDLDAVRGSADTGGFAQALAPPEWHFPRDHGPHSAFRHEWWYVTGNLDAPSGERFGFELTFFRLALLPPGPVGRAGSDATRESNSAWRARQIYVAHFAITDVARREFHVAQKYSRQALGLAGATADPFRVWIDNWSLGVPQSRTAMRNGTNWTLHAGDARYALTLEAQPLSPPVLNGEGGLSRKAADPGAASDYYSIPRIAVHGNLWRGGRALEVRGLAWLDREWGSGSLGKQQQGWDWFGLQLRDGSTLMFYSLRNRDGTRDPHSAGTWVDAAGHVRPLTSEDLSIEVTDHWVSPRGARYPSRWRIRVASIGFAAQIRPVLADQELDTRPRYWEGAVDVQASLAGRDTPGRGYVELVGYAE